MKLRLMLGYLLTCDSGTAPHTCWCSVVDLLEVAALHSLALTVWIGVPSNESALRSDVPATVLPYRHNWSAGDHAHIALYAHHFCHMHHAPSGNVRLQLPQALCLDESVGCEIQLLRSHEPSAQ